MSRALRLLTAAMVFQCFLAVGVLRADEPATKPRPDVEVVFCLDTTGSMGGLISAAKQKIWAISNQIASGQPTPRVKMGLVAYRDRGDVYITKITDLTEDLDAIHGHLMGIQAQGGGDFPESVNQALHEAVTKINWSKDKQTLKMIFLVGDAPPHMDYADDVKYPETCKLAVARDIIINTVQCGNHAETRKYWQEICRLAEGSYVQIDAHGGPIVAVATPFDADLAKINGEISRTTLVFGNREEKRAGEAKKTSNAALAPAAAADRAAYYARKGAATTYDLLTNVQNGTVKLESLKEEELPPEMQKMTREEQQKFLKDLESKRKDLSEKALELDRKRSAFIAKKQSEDTKNRARDSFDNQVLQILQRQAARNGRIQYVVGGEGKKD
jgi:Mg-chelatase subunit ChlD